MKLDERFRFPIIAIVCLAYIFLRLWNLTESCLWFDEIFSIHAAEHSWSGLFWFAAQDLIHPPLFYVLLKLWISIGGESLFWLRLFPVLFSVAALVPFFLLCRQFKLSNSTIALAAAFLALNGSLIKYAQEVRMYSLLMCLSLFSLWLFARFLNVGKGIWFLTLVNILLVHTQYFGWLIVVGEIFAVLYLQRIKIGQTMIMFGLTALSFIPWVVEVGQAAGKNSDISQNLGWAERPGPAALPQFVFNLIEPFYYQASNIDPLTIWQITVPLVLIVLTALGFCIYTWRAHSEKENNVFAFLLIIVFTPILFAFAASWVLPFSIWGTRHLIILFGPAAILQAKLLNEIRISHVKKLLIAAITLAFGAACVMYLNRPAESYIWCAWEKLITDLPRQNLTEPTKIFVFEDLVAYQVWFPLRNRENVQITRVKGIPGLPEDKAYFLPRGFDAIQTIDAAAVEGEKFYIAFRANDLNYLEQPVRFLIEKGYRIDDHHEYTAQGLRAFLVEVSR